MSVIDTLIYDRTQSDVDRVYTLRNKILQNGLSSLTQAEHDEYFGGMKGAYNYTDLNRVGNAVQYIADRFIGLQAEIDAYRIIKGVEADPVYLLPYDPDEVDVDPKTDWQVGDTPTIAQMSKYLSDISNLRGIITLPAFVPVVPATMSYFGYGSANDIEKILVDINNAIDLLKAQYERLIDLTVASWVYSGMEYAE